jgi:putative aldouronate transport system permease protein
VLKHWKQEWEFHMMIIPGFILVLIFNYGPIAGIVMAFQRFIPTKGIFGSPWIGLDNFELMFLLPETYQVLFNTIFIAGMKVIAGLIFPILIALLLNEVRIKMFKRTVQTLIYMPHFLSWVILGGILIDILSPSEGIINKLLIFMGFEPIFFLGSNSWFRPTLIISDLWKDFGFSTIIFLAALTSINPSLYEAAEVDGASRWRQTWHITLPGIRPIIVLVATLSLGQILNAGFEQVFNLYNPLVYETGDIIDTYVYRIGLEQAQYSLATAIGLLKSVVALILISTSYFLAYRFANYRIF